MRVFLTGVTGFLGSHVSEVLLQSGHDVVGLARDPAAIDRDLDPWRTPPPGSGPGAFEDAARDDLAAPKEDPRSRPTPGHGRLFVVRGSLADEHALAAAVAGADAIVHVAGLIQARTEAEYMRINRDGAGAVVRAALTRSGSLRRFVFISSQAAGGPSQDGRPVTGEDPPRPVSAYGRSKLAGEQRVLSVAGPIPVTVLRPPVVFGPRVRMLRRFFRAVARGTMVVWGDGSHRFQVVHATDVGRAVLQSIEVDHASGSILYTSDDRPLSWRSFAHTLAGVVGARVRLVHVPPPVFTLAACLSTAASLLSRRPPLFSLDKLPELREPAWLCSSRSARESLGWAPSRSIEEGLASTHAWYRSRSLL